MEKKQRKRGMNGGAGDELAVVGRWAACLLTIDPLYGGTCGGGSVQKTNRDFLNIHTPAYPRQFSFKYLQSVTLVASAFNFIWSM